MPNHDEEMARTRRIVLTREDTRAEADTLFGGAAKKMREEDTKKMRDLFVQAPASQTMAPNLQGALDKTASVAPAVDAFLEKVAHGQMSDAQRRYPELLKVAAPRAGTFPVPSAASGPKKALTETSGEVPTRSPLSGGSA